MSDPLDTPTAPGTPDAAGAPFTPGVHQAYRSGRAILKKDGTYVPMKGKTAEAAALAKVPPTVAPSAAPAIGGKEATGADPIADIMGDWPEPTQTPENGPQNGPNEGTPDAMGTPPPPQTDPTPASTVGPDATPSTGTAAADAAAQIVLGVETLAISLLGADVAMSATDRAAIERAWVSYFGRHGTPNLPPWGAVAMAHGVWLRVAVQKPTVKGRLATWWGKIAGAKKKEEKK